MGKNIIQLGMILFAAILLTGTVLAEETLTQEQTQLQEEIRVVVGKPFQQIWNAIDEINATINGINATINGIKGEILSILDSIATIEGNLIAETAARDVGDSDLKNQIDTIELTPGPQGLQGDQGTPGTQGIAGEIGATGLPGEIGPQGLQGDQGTPGTQGTPGDTGTTGLQGIQGEQGTQGDTGQTGSVGLSGYEIVRKDNPDFGIGPLAHGTAFIECPTDKKILGAGYYGVPYYISLIGMYPDSSYDNRIVFTMLNTSSSNTQPVKNFHMWATCAFVQE